IQLVDTWLACAAIGAVSVPINIANRGDFLVHQLRDSQSVVVVVDTTTVDALRTVADQLPDLRAVIAVGDVDDGGWPAGVLMLSSATLSEGDAGAVWPSEAHAVWNAPACLLYTSGTTGPSKGVVVTQHYLVTAARIVADAYGLTTSDVTYGAVPLFHFSGMLGSVLAAVVA